MKNVFLLCLIFCISNSLFAQESKPFKIDHSIQSKAFGDERKITVYLPPSYYDYPDDKYTVTYVLDGHFDPFINLGVKTIEYNTYMYKYTPTIVVGVHAKARGWEFSAPTPGDEDDENYKGGRAPELQQHFKNEIFPLIDSLYDRTLPFRSIIGHSSGGKFVLYTLFSDEKDLFDGYIGISPALRPGQNTILEDALKRLKAGEKFPKFLYCSSGTVGEREELFGGAIKRLDSILQVYPNHALIWRKSTFEGMGHWTCVGPSFNTAMVELTRAFRVDEKILDDFANNDSKTMTEQIEAFYSDRKKNYGFVEIPYGGYLSQIAYYLSDKGKIQEALDLYDWGIKQHPEHFTLTKSKAKLLFKMGNKKAAKEAFTRSLKVLEIVKPKLSEENYKDQKEYVEKKLLELSK